MINKIIILVVIFSFYLIDSKIVISQVYSRGGNSGAFFKSDFVELFNNGNDDESLVGLTLQYASATGTYNQFVALDGGNINTLQPGQYFLVRLATGSNGIELPDLPDLTSSIAIGADAGKLLIIKGTSTQIGSSIPIGAVLIDAFLYGTTTIVGQIQKGSPFTTTTSALQSFYRKLFGCQDTDSNDSDFEVGTVIPRTSQDPLNACSVQTCCTGICCDTNTCQFKTSSDSCVGSSNGGLCDDDDNDKCSGTNGDCVDAFKKDTEVCRPSNGKCDIEEKCDGSSGSCPIDNFKLSSESCVGSSNGGPCDDDDNDKCSGTNGDCVDAFKKDTEVCRPSNGKCDIEEKCDGSSGSCPIDKFKLESESCVGSSNGGPCDDDENDKCIGGICIDAFKPNTFTCRSSKGQCDIAEKCDGSSGSCPINKFKLSSEFCYGSSNGGLCDDDDNDRCSGINNVCIDAFKPNTYICRKSKGECDIEEKCSGSSPFCPKDKFQPRNYICRKSKGQCDIEEKCSGSTPFCPKDKFSPNTVKCVGSSNGGPCDKDKKDRCSGTNSDCIDAFKSKKKVCRKAKGKCDIEEKCDGSSGSCPKDKFKNSSESCVGTSNGGPCDDDDNDRCSGKNKVCIDAFKPNTFICRETGGDEYCTGSSGYCPLTLTIKKSIGRFY